jgi:glycyl-tRNA synthetase
MFDTSIGPSGDKKGYLRPETAQGQFLNFSKLLEFNNARMPFASASIGKSFRNEISPRAGLLRVREFLMAEIEHYVDPKNKKHPRFSEVKDLKCRFLPKGVQEEGRTDLTETTVGEAVSSGMVDNETLGYFLARIWLFLKKLGCDMSRVRFRQHMKNEMAHYASDCWDAELHTSYVHHHMNKLMKGWIECVGCADRSAYDLTVHSAKTNTKLVARIALDEPVVSEVWEASLDRKKLGPKFRQDAKALEETITKMGQLQLETARNVLHNDGKIEVNVSGNELVVEKDVIAIERVTKKETGILITCFR